MTGILALGPRSHNPEQGYPGETLGQRLESRVRPR